MTFFEANHDIFFFVYGLVFFELGLAIAFQSRTHSRLDLARSLNWLALFGIFHGLYEWGDIFIPIQSVNLASPSVRFLTVLNDAISDLRHNLSELRSKIGRTINLSEKTVRNYVSNLLEKFHAVRWPAGQRQLWQCG